MYWCLFLNWLLSSGISSPAELTVLSSSKRPWEEIFASWRQVGFLGCRISPLWHLASSQTCASINCCVDLQNQSCLEGRQSYSTFHVERHKERWSTSLLRVSRGSGGSRTGGSTSSVTTLMVWTVHHSLTQICAALWNTLRTFNFFLLFMLSLNKAVFCFPAAEELLTSS